MESEKRRSFVGEISWETSEATLREHFSKYGEVEDTLLITRTGHGRGFGIVSFKDPDMANQALQDQHVILDRKVDVKPAKPRGNERNQNQTIHSEEHSNGTSTSNKKIFVGGLPLNEEDFKNYFGSFGTIIDAVVIHDKETHRPRGFGFVTFDSEDVVNNLLQKSLYELKNKLVEINVKPET
ncbi:heterogeneous nuclear ribonucleoprotein 1-like [Quercus lobata]|uniref:RRM domain-containing protein n=1 Tax=Quercus lobata TaxID=97700 RepID=A0A7N2LRW9_QUELO|nr:heterogeneous nuclear ribonucleoprotein 1-like [Quercus lobata]